MICLNLSEDANFRLQAYYDRTWRSVPGRSFSDQLETYDVDFQNLFPWGERQMILWGLGYRLMADKVANSTSLAFDPADRDQQLFSGFVQDTITLVPDRWKLTLGTKFEHNDYSGFEGEPSVRLAWPPGRQTIWLAVSRAIRSPSRLDTDVTTPLTGNADFESEEVTAYEVGYRIRPVNRLSLSVSTFYNQYDDVRGIVLLANPTRFELVNGQHADTWGLDFSAIFQAADWWRLRAGYTYLHEHFSADPDVLAGSDTFEVIDPAQQVFVQSTMNLPGHLELDLTGRYVSALPASTLLPGGAITLAAATPSYATFDARIGWRFKHLEIDVTGRNLVQSEHAELGGNQIPRSVFGEVTWRF